MIPKIKKQNISDQLITTIVELIETGVWPTGEKLPNEIELAASFDVSRNIMRESTKILENFGILESRVGIGTKVSENAISCIYKMNFFESLKKDTSVETLLETRLIVEPELTYYAALRASNDEIKILREIVANDNKKYETGNFIHPDDFDFHAFIAKCSKNNILENLILSMLEQLKNSNYGNFNKYGDEEYKKKSYSFHLKILNAIESRDPLLAKDLMYNHLFNRITVINPDYGTDMKNSKKVRHENSLL